MAETTSATLSHATTGTLKRFRYHGIDIATGRQQTGELAAETAYAVRSSLRRIGFNTLTVHPLATEQSPTWLKPLIDAWHQRQRLRRRPLKADFCDAVATMLQAGIVLDEALHALAVSPTRSVVERGLAARMRDGLRAGQPLSTVCANETTWFDRFDVALISAGEQAGDLNETLLAIVNHHLRAENLNQRLFIALVYPTLLALAGLGVLEFMSHQVLPQLISLIAQSHHQPPALTMHVMALGQWLGRWWPLALVGLVASVVLIKRIIAAIPPTHIIVRILRENAWTRVTRRYRAARLAWSLSRLCRSGMPLMEAVSVAADTAKNFRLMQIAHSGQRQFTSQAMSIEDERPSR